MRLLKFLGSQGKVPPPSSLTYSTNPATYGTTSAISSNTPSSGGGAVVSYSVSPALPTGLTLNTGTGIITGTATTRTAQATYVVTATNSGGSTTCNLVITISDIGALTDVTTDMNPALGISKDGSNKIISWASQGSVAATYQPITNSATDGPLVVAAAYNGKDCVRYDGTSSRLNTTATLDPMGGASSYTAYIVLSQSSTGTSSAVLFSDENGGGTHMSWQKNGADSTDFKVVNDDGTHSGAVDAVVVADTLTLVTIKHTGTLGSLTIYTKGTQQATVANPGNPDVPASRKIGLGCQGTLGNIRFKGDLCRLLISGSTHSDAKRNAIEAELTSIYGVP